MREAGVISSQLLMRYEQRMTTSVSASLRALARDIDARWASDPIPIIAELLLKWQTTLSDLIFKFNETIAREGVVHIIRARDRKNEGVDLVMMGIRFRLRNYSRARAELIERYLRDRVARELREGVSIADARTTIRNILRNPNYAARIARTESHIALERGAFEAARSLGVRITKEWISREDAHVRPDHAAAHGQIREIEAPFDVGGEHLLYPGDPSASARNTVNCRCTVNYRLE